jgi:hypothetical protein
MGAAARAKTNKRCYEPSERERCLTQNHTMYIRACLYNSALVISATITQAASTTSEFVFGDLRGGPGVASAAGGRRISLCTNAEVRERMHKPKNIHEP